MTVDIAHRQPVWKINYLSYNYIFLNFTQVLSFFVKYFYNHTWDNVQRNYRFKIMY